MEPMELNAGRFHLRPLRQDGRVDDAPALTVAHGRGVYPEYFEDAAADWENDRVYRWAVAEQTNIELLAEVAVTLVGDDRAEVVIHVAGDPDRVVEVDDPTLEPVTVADAADAAKHVVGRWIGGYLGRTPIAPRPFPDHQGQPRPVDER